MNWLESLFLEQSALQAVCVISVIIAIGLGLGKLRVCGISLGVTFVFFTGILAGHMGLSINPEILKYAEDFGLMLFVYELGLKVGPGFFSSFRTGGIKLNMLGLGLVLAGTAVAIALSYLMAIPMTDMVGILSGATTNTPSLGAAQQALLQVHPEDTETANNMAMACAVGYPVGLIGVILCVVILRAASATKTTQKPYDPSGDNTFVVEYNVNNPAIFGKSIKEIRENADVQFVISRVWKGGKVIIPTSETIIEEDEQKNLLTYLIKEIQLNPHWENKSPLKWIEFNFPIYRNGEEVRKVLCEENPNVETLVLLCRK